MPRHLLPSTYNRAAALTLLLLSAAAARAATPPLAVELDGAPPTEEASVADDDLVLRRAGAELGRVKGAGGLTGLSLKQEQADGMSVLAARGRRGAQPWLVLVALREGKLSIIHDGPIGPIGRDQEHAVTVTLQPDALTRHQSAPGFTRCDGEARLFLERYQAGRWQPLVPPLPADVARGPRPEARRAPPEALPIFRFSAASTQAGIERADQLTPPRELEDGRPDTSWRVSGDARGAWVTARAEGAPRAVRGLFLQPPTGAKLRAPQTLAAVFADGRGVIFDVLPGPQLLRWPEPVVSSCVSLVVVAGAPAGMTTALAEVRVTSDLDDQGPRGLVQLAAGTSKEAEAAARALTLLPPQQAGAVLSALAEALPGARGPGRQRLLAVLTPLCEAAPGQQRTIAALLQRLLETGGDEERRALWPLLERQGPEGASALLSLASASTTAAPVRAEALQQLGRHADLGALKLLLSLAAPQEVTTDPRIPRAAQLALAAALRCQPLVDREGRSGPAVVDREGHSGPTVVNPRWAPVQEALKQGSAASRAALVEVIGQALTRCPDAATRAAAVPLLLSQWPAVWAQDKQEPADFLLSLRLLRALAALGTATPESAKQVGQVLTARTSLAADPVLRAAAATAAAVAFRALGPAFGELARRGVGDADPGVRIAALQALAGQGDAATLITMEQALAGDRWPQVRRAAVEALAAACPTPPTGAKPDTRALRDAVRDRDSEVQRLALAAVQRCEGAAATDLLTTVALREDAAPPLRGTACGLLGQSGPSAAPVLTRVLADVLTAPSPEESYLAMALRCTRAFAQVARGDDGAVLAPALAPEVPSVLRLAALQALGQACERAPALPSSLKAPLDGAARETEGRVRAAAAHALKRCAPRAR